MTRAAAARDRRIETFEALEAALVEGLRRAEGFHFPKDKATAIKVAVETAGFRFTLTPHGAFKAAGRAK